MTETVIRYMTSSDVTEVAQIESLSFDTPWPKSGFQKCLANPKLTCWVAQTDDIIASFCVFQEHKRKIEIVSIATHPDSHRQGFGSSFFFYLTDKLKVKTRTRVSMDVDEKNLKGHMFLKSCGFIAVGINPSTEDEGTTVYRFVYRMPVEEGVEADV
jgi:ribosomal-protein-alanine N-acetyltransferase